MTLCWRTDEMPILFATFDNYPRGWFPHSFSSYLCVLRITNVNLQSQLLWKGERKLLVWTAAGPSPGLPWVSCIRLWHQAKRRDAFPGSLWLSKLVLHLVKMVRWNVYSLWAEADVNLAHKPRTSTRMFVILCSAAHLRAPGSRRICPGRPGRTAPPA